MEDPKNLENYEKSFSFKNPNELDGERFMKRCNEVIKKLSQSKRFSLIVKTIAPLLVGTNLVVISLVTRLRNEVIISIVLYKDTCTVNVKTTKKLYSRKFFYPFIKEKVKEILGEG